MKNPLIPTFVAIICFDHLNHFYQKNRKIENEEKWNIREIYEKMMELFKAANISMEMIEDDTTRFK